ncbi:MAG: DedA family protein [Bacillota bacterium]
MDWSTGVMQTFGYPGIVLVVLIENLFPPIPSEVVLPFAGFLTTYGGLTVPGVAAAATLGSTLGATALYWIGMWLGRERIYRTVQRFGRALTVSERDVLRAEDWFQRHGTWTVFFCRMIPVLRSLISIPAGLVRMRLSVFIVYTALGSLVWNLLLIGLGAALGAAWPAVTAWLAYYRNLVFVVVAAVLLTIGFMRWRRRRPR